MSDLRDAWDDFAAVLAAAGLTVFTDPRNISPPGVMVDMPSVTSIGANMFVLEHRVIALSSGPGNGNAAAQLLDIVDTVAATTPVTSAEPGVYSAGAAEMPSYRLTCPVTYRR